MSAEVLESSMELFSQLRGVRRARRGARRLRALLFGGAGAAHARRARAAGDEALHRALQPGHAARVPLRAADRGGHQRARHRRRLCPGAAVRLARHGRGATSRIGLNETQLGIGLPSSVLEPLQAGGAARVAGADRLRGRLVRAARALALGLVHELCAARQSSRRARRRGRRRWRRCRRRRWRRSSSGCGAPALETIARVSADETERWLDTWFSPAARARLSDAVQRLRR